MRRLKWHLTGRKQGSAAVPEALGREERERNARSSRQASGRRARRARSGAAALAGSARSEPRSSVTPTRRRSKRRRGRREAGKKASYAESSKKQNKKHTRREERAAKARIRERRLRVRADQNPITFIKTNAPAAPKIETERRGSRARGRERGASLRRLQSRRPPLNSGAIKSSALGPS